MPELLRKFQSRKFLLALGATITFIANDDYGAAVTVIIGYLAAEGIIDIINLKKK